MVARRLHLVRIACVIVALLVSLGNRARALDQPEAASGYVSKNFSVEDGLLSNNVNVLLQTRDGFLWIGTPDGLLRFDGRHFTPVKFLPQDSPVVVSALVEAPDGALWVGTPGGLARIPSGGSGESGHMVSSLYHPGSGDGDSVQCLHFSRNGDLWVGTLTGLYRFADGKFSTIIPKLWTSRIEEASNGHLLVITSQGFVEWDGKQIIQHPDLPARLGVVQHGIFHVIEDHAGTIWYGTTAGVARERGGSIERLKPYGGDGNLNVVYRLYEDPQGNVWFAQSGDLYRATAAGRVPIASNLDATYLAADRDGDLWAGTRSRGLFRLKSQAVKMFTAADGLPVGMPMAVLAASDGFTVNQGRTGMGPIENLDVRIVDQDPLQPACNALCLAITEDGDRQSVPRHFRARSAAKSDDNETNRDKDRDEPRPFAETEIAIVHRLPPDLGKGFRSPRRRY